MATKRKTPAAITRLEQTIAKRTRESAEICDEIRLKKHLAGRYGQMSYARVQESVRLRSMGEQGTAVFNKLKTEKGFWAGREKQANREAKSLEKVLGRVRKRNQLDKKKLATMKIAAKIESPTQRKKKALQKAAKSGLMGPKRKNPTNFWKGTK